MSAAQVSINQLGQLVRTVRKEQGMRLVEAAGLCGVSPRFLSELENGRDTCTLRLVLQVCNTLGIDLYATRRNGASM